MALPLLSLALLLARPRGLLHHHHPTWVGEGVWDRAVGDLVLKGDARGYTLPFNLDHLGVVWMKRRMCSTAWVTPGHACHCSYQYGRGNAAVGPQSHDSIWNGIIRLWGRVAPLLTLWCTKGEVLSGVNLNRYAGWGSSIPRYSDNEPLFGDQSYPQVVVSMSLGSSVDFRVCRRGKRNAPSSIRLDYGDLLIMDGLAQIGVRAFNFLQAARPPGQPYLPMGIPAHSVMQASVRCSGGTKGPEAGPFPSRKADCLLDLRILPGHWSQ